MKRVFAVRCPKCGYLGANTTEPWPLRLRAMCKDCGQELQVTRGLLVNAEQLSGNQIWKATCLAAQNLGLRHGQDEMTLYRTKSVIVFTLERVNTCS